jgi:flagellar motor switch protein FliM
MKKQSFKRILKLGPAIGDWTKIKFQDPNLFEVQISEVLNVNFDSLSRDDMKELHILHYRLAEQLSKLLAKDLDIKVEMHTVSASQMTYKEFMSSQSEKVVQADYLLKDLGRVNVLFDWALADMVVNRMTGGKGDQNDEYSFSDIEAAILESQMESLKKEFSSVWDNVFDADQLSMKFSYGSYVYDKKFSLREAYIVFTFHLYFGKGELTKVSWAYPNDVLRYLLSEMKSQKKPLKQSVKLSPKTLNSIKVPVKAELGKTTLKMRDLKSLQKGDVIPLDTFFDKPVEFTLGSSTRLQSQPGVYNQRVGLQLLLSDEKETVVTPLTLKATELTEHEEGVLESTYNSTHIPSPIINSDLNESNFISKVVSDKVLPNSQKMTNVKKEPVLNSENLDVKSDFEKESVLEKEREPDLKVEEELILDTIEQTDPVEEKSEIDVAQVNAELEETIEPEQLDVMAKESDLTLEDASEDELQVLTENPQPDKDVVVKSKENENEIISEKVESSAEELEDDLDFDDDFSWDDLDEDL